MQVELFLSVLSIGESQLFRMGIETTTYSAYKAETLFSKLTRLSSLVASFGSFGSMQVALTKNPFSLKSSFYLKSSGFSTTLSYY